MNSAPNPVETGPVVPVSLLVNTARLLIERHLPLLWVSGEISNFTRAASGHCYFVLKDAAAQVRCVLFRFKAQALDVRLADGLHVEVRAAPSIYEARGEFQLNVETVRLAGVGRLYEAFVRLKAALEARGWFAAERKRPLPTLPRAVGVVTSPGGAAIRDVLTTLQRRFPAVPVYVYPVPVQGEGAAARIAEAIAVANRRAEVDVLVVCRGGGSIEDLWAFNEEIVARAVVESAIPIVAGVGHETDFTICDFVADVRAPTPTAAAVCAVPDRHALIAGVGALAMRLQRSGERRLESAMQRVDDAARRLRHPAERIGEQRALLTALARRLQAAADLQLERAANRLTRSRERMRPPALLLTQAPQLHARRAERLLQAIGAVLQTRERRVDLLRQGLELLNPRSVLERGYAVVTDAAGRAISTAAMLAPGVSVEIEFAHDRAEATIDRIRPGSGAGPDTSESA